VLLALLLIFPFVSAADEHAGDISIDNSLAYCREHRDLFTSIKCVLIELISASTNKMTAEDEEQALSNVNTVIDLSKAILDLEMKNSSSRLAAQWFNIYALIVLTIEIFQIAFYLVLLILLVHLPFLYLRLLNIFKEMLYKGFERRAKK